MYSRDEIEKKFTEFEEVLGSFKKQIDAKFEPSMIELQQTTTLNYNTKAIDKQKEALAKKLMVHENELNKEVTVENVKAVFVLLVGLACLLMNELVQFGSFNRITS